MRAGSRSIIRNGESAEILLGGVGGGGEKGKQKTGGSKKIYNSDAESYKKVEVGTLGIWVFWGCEKRE
ncbi:hypothetical protein ACQWHR_26865, partial [Salmonella enterica subsp. enterica serovar Infantis]